MQVNEPVFIISVAARLVQMHPQTLRKYEREGLVEPSRTVGNLRLYSDRDIERLRQVKYLVEHRGLNLAGVQIALATTNRLLRMRQRLPLDTGEPALDETIVQEIDQLLTYLGYRSL